MFICVRWALSSKVLDDRVGHHFGSDGWFSKGDVTGAYEINRDGFVHGGFDLRGDGIEAEAVTEHERGGENLGAGIGDAFACDVRGGAASGFVEAERFAEGILARAERG